jgi:hypothetical protein
MQTLLDAAAVAGHTLVAPASSAERKASNEPS